MKTESRAVPLRELDRTTGLQLFVCASSRDCTRPGLRLNEHLEHEDGEVVFRHACKLGLEGIVSKRKDSPIAQVARPIGSR